jgi:rod shape-determining protein MreD
VTPEGWARVRIGILLILAIVVQTTFGSDFRILGVAPDLMLLVSACAGLSGGAEAGAFVGFCAGMLADLALTTTPLGLSALAWCLVGWGVGSVRANALPGTRSVLPVIGLLATGSGVVLFLVLGDLVGQSQLIDLGRTYLVKVGVIESLWSALLILPVAFVYERAAQGSAGAVELRRPDSLAVR